jgi:polysaccharide pyruvyl transferase WcaK-like protein
MGCSALTTSLIGLLHTAAPDAEIRLLYGHECGGKRSVLLASNTRLEVEIVNCRMSPRSRLREHRFWILGAAFLYRLIPLSALRSRLANSTPWLRCLLEANLIGDIRGGDSFSDIYGIRRLLLAASEYLVVSLLGKRVSLLPQTCGPFRSKISRVVAHWILKQAPVILVRDRRSEEIAKELLGDTGKETRVKLCPDVAFSLPAVAPPRIEITPPFESSSQTCLVGVNINGLLYMGGYTRDNMFRLQCNYPEFCNELVKQLASIPNTRVLLIPHTFGSHPPLEEDEGACRKVWESVRGTGIFDNVHFLEGSYDQSEIKNVIGRCDFLLGARMHACIAALSQGIPCVGLAYSRKFAGVFETAGMADMVLDMCKLPAGELINRCMRLFEQRVDTAQKLETAIPEVKERLRATFAHELLDEGLSYPVKKA